MGKIIVQGGAGGGVSSDECTASKANVLKGFKTITTDSDDELVEGTMPNNGAINKTLNCGDSLTIPEGYTSGGKVTVNDLASQTAGTATAGYIYSGKTAVVNGQKITGTMTCSSILSFSVAAYSTTQVICTWKNPAKGPFSGVAICAKVGGYPTSIQDSRVYTGVGNNSAANGTSSAIIGGLSAGTTYYFRVWAYVSCSAGDFYSNYLQATGSPTSHGRAAYTSSGTFTVPAGVRSINIHCTGAGSKGCSGYSRDHYAGGGGGGGYISYKTGIAVNPGAVIAVVVGAGGTTDDSSTNGSNAPSSSASLNGTVLVSAVGGSNGNYSSTIMHAYSGRSGGNSGGTGATFDGATRYWDNSSAGGSSASVSEFGNGTRYSGGGGGGGGTRYSSGGESTFNDYGSAGGSGGGGAGAGSNTGSGWGGWGVNGHAGAAGSAGTGGGGGGGAYGTNNNTAGNGGSGNVIITW